MPSLNTTRQRYDPHPLPRYLHEITPLRTDPQEPQSATFDQFRHKGKMVMRLLFSPYPQTWAINVSLSRIPIVGNYIYEFNRWLCGKLTGHHISKTEWGYGIGNGYGDVWCRWCNCMGQVPLSDLSRFENARHTIWGATGCDITQTVVKDSLTTVADEQP